ncbi:MAG: hypothetical protein JNM81_10655 [Rhodospirillaceae bacterium]|nr:hypothetical protein [Rhodospirillaceae bacterium]
MNINNTNTRTFFSRFNRARSHWGVFGLVAVLLLGIGVWLEVSLRMLPQPAISQPRLLSPQDPHTPALTIQRVSAHARDVGRAD